MKPKSAQMKIQQMAFMIVAVLFFFILVGLFFLSWQYKSVRGNYAQLQKDSAISSLSVLTDMPELTCGYLCLDADKLQAMVGKSESYRDFWSVASIEVRKVHPEVSEWVECPSADCNVYEVYDSGQTNQKKYSTYVSLCKKIKEGGYIYDNCDIAKLIVGVEVDDGD